MSGAGVTSSKLPLRPVPGSYGPPILGPLIDRLNYFWFQGPAKFFTARMDEHKSTVFRTNMPPGPPGFCNDPRVVMLLDAKSFAVLFDNKTVEKRNVFTGRFMPSVRFNGGYRVLPTSTPRRFQPIATRDPKVFENPDEFVATRFIENKKVIKYVLWSNGFETDDPTVHNKQCPGKNLA
ncbi:hypothetical protein SUGI_0004650 [Cryptomeria japonica]|nr:hypothetical protein SUGI_0004650 [Cryptomeria japonica]